MYLCGVFKISSFLSSTEKLCKYTVVALDVLGCNLTADVFACRD